MAGDFEYEWSQLVARAWADPAFKAKLLADPAAVLKENSLTPPPGVQLKVVENTDKVIHLVLPTKPSSQELSEAELQQVAGGHCRGCGGCRGGEGRERCRCERCRE
ncbi:MAG TPA: NHLP leader peptide family RiPP precursor [Gemmataceae bacterium]|nr:NHLP leader peptide family RiPP precursor [Gemmataceae bacterium]